jgi:hypothetical protein
LTESKQNDTSFVMGKILLISSPILILDISVWKDIPFLPSFLKKTINNQNPVKLSTSVLLVSTNGEEYKSTKNWFYSELNPWLPENDTLYYIPLFM